jgi:hypothetical protein
LHIGGVLIRKKIRIGINARGYCASNLVENMRIDMCRSMMECDNPKNMYNSMEIGTIIGVATSFYSYIGRNPKELVNIIEVT